MQPKISVIVPIYNIEKYVEECIKSILEQSYNNIELILVDDGASDSSGEICDGWAKKDARIKVVHQKNGGLACAVNTGLQHVTGEWILFVDGDDFIFPHTLQHVIELQQKHEADLVIYDFSFDKQVESSEEVLIHTNNIGALKNLYIRNSEYKNIRLVTTVRWTKLYRKEVLDGIVFPEGRIHEDEIVHEILYRCKKVLYTNRKCYFYRQREDSIVHETISIKVLDKLQAFKERVHFFENIENTELMNLAINKFVLLFIQMFCKSENVKEESEKKRFMERLDEYEAWADAYKKQLYGKAKAELILYKCCPWLVKKLYQIKH